MNTLILLTLFSATSAKFDLPTDLLASLCFIESSYNINAVHHDDGGEDSLGVCQIKLNTAKWLGFKGTKKQLMNPETNMYYAAKYLSYQIKRYHSVQRGVIAYNMGNAKNLTITKYSAKVFKKWHSTRGTNVRRTASFEER